MNPWLTLTHFASSSVLLPLAFIIAIWLIYLGTWRGAFAWLVLFGIGLTLVVATKIAFIGWGIGIKSWDFTGVSGHSMRASAVYPILIYLILLRFSLLIRLIGAAIGLGFAYLIGFSRILLHAHSVAEVIIGCMVGSLIAFIFIYYALKLKSTRPISILIAISLISIALLLQQKSVPSQRMIIATSIYLSGHDKPFVRVAWHANKNKESRIKEKSD